jgi:hypothetical protein
MDHLLITSNVLGAATIALGRPPAKLERGRLVFLLSSLRFAGATPDQRRGHFAQHQINAAAISPCLGRERQG